jgi:hypothetical protein
MRGSRRRFAAPFVVTASLTSCARYEPPPPVVPPPRDAEVVVVVPPATPIDAAAELKLFAEPDPDVTTWSVTMYGTACQLQYEMHCPPTASCNPPRPSAFKCPVGMTPERRAYITQRKSTGTCTFAFEERFCDLDEPCVKNPPPRKIECPR